MRKRLTIGWLLAMLALLVICPAIDAATFYRQIDADVQVSEASAAKRTLYYQVNTHEAQTITVSKAGGGFGATAGSTGTQVTGVVYKLVIHADDIDTEGDVAFCSTGATDIHYIFGVRVVDHDPFDAVAEILDDTGTSGVQIPAGEIDAAAIADNAIDHGAIATDAIGTAELATTAVDEIAAAVNAENRGIYYYQVQRNCSLAARRTLYFRATGTLPAKASMSLNGGSFADSTNAPGTVNGAFRKLELTRAETARTGRLVINITTSVTVNYVVLIVDFVSYDPFTQGAMR